MKIYKYTFSRDFDLIVNNIITVNLPGGSKILTTQLQDSAIVMWYAAPDIVDIKADPQIYHFKLYVTGSENIPTNSRYMNTFQFDDGQFVIHMFEL